MRAIKGIIIFASGVAVGAASAYIFIKHKLVKNYNDKFAEDINSTREQYEAAIKRVEDLEEKLGKSFYSTETEESEDIVDSPDDMNTYYEEHKDDKNFTDYARFYMVSEDPDDPGPINPTDAPYFIDRSEYGEIMDYDLVTISWYKDGKLAYDDFDYVDDPEYFLGKNFFKEWNEHIDNNSIFIRNPFMERDYEIKRIDDMTYFEAGGVDE